MSLRIADDIENFKPNLHFAILIVVLPWVYIFLNMICALLVIPDARYGYGNRLPFATAPEAI